MIRPMEYNGLLLDQNKINISNREMKKIFRYLAMVTIAAGSLLLGSCHGQSDDDDTPTTDPKTEVPDGVLRIFVDKNEIEANGSDLATFTVMFGKEDVSTNKTLQLIRTCEGVETYMPYGVNSFSTVVGGEYSFRAEYYNAGKYYTDNNVIVVAKSNAVAGETKNYKQHTLGFQFTSVGCTSCPTLAANLKAICSNFPGRVIPVAFHQDFDMQDPMTHPMTASYYKLIKRQGLPQFNANLIIDDSYITVLDYATIVEILDRVEANYPATCGVAIESSQIVDGASDGDVEVTVKVTSNTPSAYRYQIFLVEDGVNEYQAGEGSGYVHNNVVRVVSSNSVYGDRLNEGVPFQIGVEVSATKTLEIPAECKVENMRVVAVAFVSYDGGSTYVVNNCAECRINESIDYGVE